MVAEDIMVARASACKAYRCVLGGAFSRRGAASAVWRAAGCGWSGSAADTRPCGLCDAHRGGPSLGRSLARRYLPMASISIVCRQSPCDSRFWS